MYGIGLLGLLLGCAGEAPLADRTDGQVEVAFRELHRRIYGVYDLAPERDPVHDWLSASFAGETLTREYIEHFTTLTRLEAEGMWVEPLGVAYDDVLVVGRSGEGVQVEAAWTVRGIVHHPTHEHERVNHYRAIYTVAERGAGPRLVGVRMKNVRRLAAEVPETTTFP